MVPKYHQGLTASAIKTLVCEFPILLEIGCHEGTDTAKFLAAMPGARLFCFDCEQRALARFKQTIGDDFRVTLIEKAVADIDGSRLFYSSTGKVGKQDDWDFSGSLHEPTGHLTRSPEILFKKPAPVPCLRLDTWLKNEPKIDAIDFIWADVQGSQRLLITGGIMALSMTRYLYIESHDPVAYLGEPTQEELIEELASLFEPIGVYAENILFRNKRPQ